MTRGFVATAVLLTLIAVVPARVLSPSAWLGGIALAAIYAGSVLLHEAAHAVAAWAKGFRVTTVRLSWRGGETHYEGASTSATPPVIIPAAGVLASGALAVVCVGLVATQWSSGDPAGWSGWSAFAAQVNLLLTVVNALPLPGHDGAAVLGSWRAPREGRLTR